MSEKLWRGWIVWSKNKGRFLYHLWNECQCDVCGENEECTPCIAIPEAEYTALLTRAERAAQEREQRDKLIAEVAEFLQCYVSANAQWFQSGKGLMSMPSPREAKSLLDAILAPREQKKGDGR